MNYRSCSVATAAVLCLFGTLNSSMGAEDPYATMLKRHYPHGIHKLRTNTNDTSIVWQSETLDNGKVTRSTQEYHSLNDFTTALLARALHKKAYIEIAGMWEHTSAPDTDGKLNEALLRVLRDNGYEEAGYANLKKHYGPNGNNFVDAIRDDGKILWTSSVIDDDRLIRRTRRFNSVDEFKKAFLNAKLHKTAAISVHLRPVKFEGAYARAEAILDFLRQNGYDKAGGASN